MSSNTNTHAKMQHQQPAASIPDAPIPSYEEAANLPLPPGPPPQQILSSAGPAADELPSYTELDANQTSFMLYSTFIHTPTSAAYQLSSALDSANSPLHIRRLRAEEIPLAHNVPIPFDKARTLYDVADPPWRANEYYLRGQRSHCFNGTLQLRFGYRTWHVSHDIGPESRPREMMTCRKVSAGFGRGKQRVKRGNFEEPFEWKDLQGRLLATEGLQRMTDGGIVPAIELAEGLDQMWRELMISLWISRLWASFRVL
jgi:hypothetical protein